MDAELLVTQYHNGAVQILLVYDDHTLAVSDAHVINTLDDPVAVEFTKPSSGRTVQATIPAHVDIVVHIPAANKLVLVRDEFGQPVLTNDLRIASHTSVRY